MGSHFKVKSITDLSKIDASTKFDESDFCFIEAGKFIQLEYVEDETPKQKEPYPVHPGIYTMASSMRKLFLEPTAFTQEALLDKFISTKDITEKMDKFFNKFNIYKELELGTPRRGVLLFGPAGTGKTSLLKQVVKKYNADGKTLIVIWPSDKYDPADVKDFIKTFDYKAVDKVILIIEDLGGVEIDKVRIKSQSSLLSLLDNQEEIFKIPVLIIATTNFPENFLGNITNRPQRFDDKVEIGYPPGDARSELLAFFSKGKIEASVLEKIKDKKYEKFTPAHLKEIIIRAAIYDKDANIVIDEISKEIADFEKAFSKTKKLGITSDDYDY